MEHIKFNTVPIGEITNPRIMLEDYHRRSAGKCLTDTVICFQVLSQNALQKFA
jgi:hypothetical protein